VNEAQSCAAKTGCGFGAVAAAFATACGSAVRNTGATREYVYNGGQLLAKIESGATRYYLQDHLSNRVTTDANGGSATQSGHYPFGENWYQTDSTLPGKLKFTRSTRPARRARSGQASCERVAESSNDYPSTSLRAGALFRIAEAPPLRAPLIRRVLIP
jgi:hypothetical protein